ncbi:MAG: asparagine synthase (glutamine-hydrolyzing), partial [Bacteroidetes bacterium]|nr:asparagine synthase (glutamine-hydrolyzing) [Bacteroidota bacterium]
MCGIAGYIDLNPNGSPNDSGDIDRMIGSLIHRGPDDKGVWMDPDLGIAMGHTRLSIQDLSDAGHQPMKSSSGRYIIVFNGEIYNFKDLKKEIDRINPLSNWTGHSDTEVMLAAFDAWGLELSLERFVGMFAFALWDRKERTLFLVRDRMGEKPLYYGLSGKVFLFGSELKSLAKHRSWVGEINKDAVASYLKYGYVPSPHSIYQGIFKAMPGNIITITYDELGKSGEFPSKAYWSIDKVIANARENRLPIDGQSINDDLENILCASLNDQMIADVPVGAFLSGGIDSTLVVSLMQSQTSRKIRTFSIGFRENEFNEAVHARSIAEHLGTDHTELTVTYDDALSLIPDLPAIWDEPFADASQIPTYLVSKLAQQSVKVCLSGDGGDELFGGYNRYLLGHKLWSRSNIMPLHLRRIITKGLKSLSPSLIQKISRFMPTKYRYSEMDNKLNKLAEILDS